MPMVHDSNNDEGGGLSVVKNRQKIGNTDLVLNEGMPLIGHEPETKNGVPGLPAPLTAAFAAVD